MNSDPLNAGQDHRPPLELATNRQHGFLKLRSLNVIDKTDTSETRYSARSASTGFKEAALRAGK
jgi:hypothetical protein